MLGVEGCLTPCALSLLALRDLLLLLAAHVAKVHLFRDSAGRAISVDVALIELSDANRELGGESAELSIVRVGLDVKELKSPIVEVGVGIKCQRIAGEQRAPRNTLAPMPEATGVRQVSRRKLGDAMTHEGIVAAGMEEVQNQPADHNKSTWHKACLPGKKMIIHVFIAVYNRKK